MPTHKQLLRKARKMGHEITPTLGAELLTLSKVSDAEMQRAYEGCVIEKLAHDFRVSKAVMEQRLVNLHRE